MSGLQKVERIAGTLFAILVLAHIVAAIAFVFGGYRAVFEEHQIAEDKRELRISPGSSLNDVLEILEARDLAPSPLKVRLTLLLKKREIVVKKGVYTLPERASTWSLLEQFDSGRVRLFRVTIPEGLDKWQVAELLGESRWGTREEFSALIDDPSPVLELDPRAEDLEGYLFPETYAFGEDATPREIIETMVRELITRTDPLMPRLEDSGMSFRDWLTLASLVEKETAVPEERARIAGVFSNRLDRNMLLQCDPTIIYSLKREGRYRGKIYRSDIRFESPYNTYVSKGLPPGPIASPSLASMAAALEPEDTPYFYFVAKPDGSHYFSRTLREHNRAVRRFRR